MFKWFKKNTYIFLIGGCFIIGLWSMMWLNHNDSSETDEEKAYPVPRIEELRETTNLQRRDLSLPHSRIVLNPYQFQLPADQITPYSYSNRSDLPMNLGYLSAPSQNRELLELITVYKHHAGQGEVRTAWVGDLHRAGAWDAGYDHAPGGSKLEMTEEGLYFEVTEQADPVWQPLRTADPIKINLDETPYLQISVPENEGAWTVKVNDGTMAVDAVLKTESPGTGLFQVHIPEMTGWQGTKSFEVIVFAVGISSHLTIDDIRIVGSTEVLETADSFDTHWLPHELPFMAAYADGLKLYGRDYFFDPYTVVREMEFDSFETGQRVVIGGRYDGTPQWIEEEQTLIIEQDTYSYAIQLHTKASDLSFYHSRPEFMAGVELDSPPQFSGYWSYEVALEDLNQDKLAISLAFIDAYEDRDLLLERVNAPQNQSLREEAKKHNEAYWNQYLSALPHPRSFHIQSVNPKGVTAEAVRKAYYKAWIFLAMNVLPKYLDEGYPYPEMATGKASLWAEGEEAAPFSATWESLVGIQYYGYIDIETAWDAFKGLMSLVDAKGMIQGESLPSRKAQTAYVLYQMNKDKASLQEVYPALNRYLNWRMRFPQWIYKSSPDPYAKDAEFAASALVDIQFMREISRILEREEEAAVWEEKRKSFLENYLQWFWDSEYEGPHQYYWSNSGKTDPGHTLWVTTGLAVEGLEGGYLQSMIDRFTSKFDTDRSFGGLAHPKYANTSYTILGLEKHGYHKLARQLNEVSIRDIVRTNAVFSEEYTNDDVPVPDGVRPSLFGAIQLIESVLYLNQTEVIKTREPIGLE